MMKDSGRVPGSREPSQSSVVSALTGFDPARKSEAFQIELDAIQRRNALIASEEAALAVQWLLESGRRCINNPEGYGHSWRGADEGRKYHKLALDEAATALNQRAVELALADLEQGYAQAIEARRADDAEGGSVGDESAVAEPCAQTSEQSDSSPEGGR